MNTVLTQLEVQSSAAKKLEAHLMERLAVERERLEGDVEEKKSTQLRARIAQLKELLALFKPNEPAEVDVDS